MDFHTPPGNILVNLNDIDEVLNKVINTTNITICQAAFVELPHLQATNDLLIGINNDEAKKTILRAHFNTN